MGVGVVFMDWIGCWLVGIRKSGLESRREARRNGHFGNLEENRGEKHGERGKGKEHKQVSHFRGWLVGGWGCAGDGTRRSD